MIEFAKWFYNNLGNSKEQRFKRLVEIIIIIGVIIMLTVNVGYDKIKGLYWKPADISFKNGGRTNE